MSSYIRLALVRQDSVGDSLAKSAIHSDFSVPGSCTVVVPVAATLRRKPSSALDATATVIFGSSSGRNLNSAGSSNTSPSSLPSGARPK